MVEGVEGASMDAGNCRRCGGADLHHAQVRSAFWHDERLVVVEGIPALVCEACREQYLDDRTVVMLDLLRGEGFPEGKAHAEIRVPVFTLPDRSAPT